MGRGCWGVGVATKNPVIFVHMKFRRHSVTHIYLSPLPPPTLCCSQDCNLCAIHGGRITVLSKDLTLASRITDCWQQAGGSHVESASVPAATKSLPPKRNHK
jgi:hypothetical protein